MESADCFKQGRVVPESAQVCQLGTPSRRGATQRGWGTAAGSWGATPDQSELFTQERTEWCAILEGEVTTVAHGATSVFGARLAVGAAVTFTPPCLFSVGNQT
jgi:uncharacterized cupin superfamily protein